MKDAKQQIQEDQGTQNMINIKIYIPRHIIIKLHEIKDKGKLLKEARGPKQLIYKRARIRIT